MLSTAERRNDYEVRLAQLHAGFSSWLSGGPATIQSTHHGETEVTRDGQLEPLDRFSGWPAPLRGSTAGTHAVPGPAPFLAYHVDHYVPAEGSDFEGPSGWAGPESRRVGLSSLRKRVRAPSALGGAACTLRTATQKSGAF